MDGLDAAPSSAPTKFTPARRLVLPLLLFALALTPQAQEPLQTTTFQATSNLVVLDVVVTDRSGKVVTNLTRDDFTVREDGVEQTIATFELPPKAGERGHGTVVGKSSEPIPDSSANAVSPQALNILVLDELNGEVLDQAYGRAAIEKYLAKHGPRLEQQTSLMLLGQKRIELLHDFTQDARALADALHRRHAELPFGLMASEFEGSNERLSKTLWALQEIAYANSHFAGRKNVIWIGPGFPAINGQSLDPADRPRFVSAVSESAHSLLQARVAVYTLNPRGLEISPANYGSMEGNSFLTGTQDDSLGDLVFESIAPETGGQILRLRNDVDVAIAESVEDGSAYYSLAYYPKNHNWNRKYRKIQIAVRGDHLQARTRKGYYGIADGPLNDNQVDTVLSRAVMNPLPYRALTIEAKAKPAGVGKGRFLIKVDRHDLSWVTLPDGKHRCEVTIVVASVGDGDRVFNHKVSEMEAVVDDKRFEQQWNKPANFDVVVDLPPKTRYVRIVVRDAKSDHIGSADLAHDALPFR